MTSIDIAHLRSWIGRVQSDQDQVTHRMEREFRATLAPWIFATAAAEAPLAFHWCLSPSIAPASELSVDGHPQRGDFLPPVPLPRRMWAGGTLRQHQALPLGASVTRVSTIADVTVKAGRSGVMCFVAIDHDYLVDGIAAIQERHDIVYRAAADAPPVAGSATSPAAMAAATRTESPEVFPAPGLTWHLTPDALLLFRYSALTFNSHRIHYDDRYTRQVEGYAGLLVHGPLQASLLLNAAATLAGKRPERFSYRGVAPLTVGNPVRVHAGIADSGRVVCWTESDQGIHMKAEATW